MGEQTGNNGRERERDEELLDSNWELLHLKPKQWHL